MDYKELEESYKHGNINDGIILAEYYITHKDSKEEKYKGTKILMNLVENHNSFALQKYCEIFEKLWWSDEFNNYYFNKLTSLGIVNDTDDNSLVNLLCTYVSLTQASYAYKILADREVSAYCAMYAKLAFYLDEAFDTILEDYFKDDKQSYKLFKEKYNKALDCLEIPLNMDPKDIEDYLDIALKCKYPLAYGLAGDIDLSQRNTPIPRAFCQYSFENYYIKGAELDDPYCLAYVGDEYIKGINVSPNPVKGLEYIQKAAEKNEPSACRILGCLYLSGYSYNNTNICPQDTNKGLEWLHIAVNSHPKDSIAIALLSDIYANGYLGVEKDLTKYNELKKTYFSNSLNRLKLGMIYEFGLYGFPKNYKIAKYIYHELENDFLEANQGLVRIYSDYNSNEDNLRECYNYRSKLAEKLHDIDNIHYFEQINFEHNNIPRTRYYLKLGIRIFDNVSSVFLFHTYAENVDIKKWIKLAKKFKLKDLPIAIDCLSGSEVTFVNTVNNIDISKSKFKYKSKAKSIISNFMLTIYYIKHKQYDKAETYANKLSHDLDLDTAKNIIDIFNYINKKVVSLENDFGPITIIFQGPITLDKVIHKSR